ncbi:MAG TPA: 5-(carboxyamino)imidazole ribonucleotide mutase [bacterium]|jgi:5-(carboxyamino)imidazole ribonucleotide mutase|nr:5-(carboxyamino)imidazole ribonucleotide mutase [bacterium]
MKKVMILMGSDSDWSIMKKAAEVIKEFGVDFEVRVCSAHRTPAKTVDIVESFDGACFIVGAGAAAHLAGVVAAHTIKPVIGVPINATSINGVDALYSTVQMPSGIPVACMAVDGAKNAGLFALQIISVSDKEIGAKLAQFKKNMVTEVNSKDEKIQKLAKEI